MVKRIAPVVSVVLLAACGAVCQDISQSLPDAPSVQAAIQAQRFNVFTGESRPPLTFGAMGAHAGAMRPGGFAAPGKLVLSQKESNTIFGKYLYPSLLKQQSGYHSSSPGTVMGRATYATSRIFVTRDASGKGRLNTSYLLRALTSVAADTASRPYWRRSFSEPFSNLGSTVGNDAGLNLWHEFGPGIQHLMKSHAPKFVARIGERIVHQ
jgi:hypothetical protein